MKEYALIFKLPKTVNNPIIKKYSTPITNKQFMDYCNQMFSANIKGDIKRQIEIRDAFFNKRVVYVLPEDIVYHGLIRFGIEGEWVYIDFNSSGNWGTFSVFKSKKDAIEEANILEREINIIEE